MSTVELDDYAREAYASYVEESETIAAAGARREKAKQALIAFMVTADGADTATLDGEPVLSFAYVNGARFDIKRFELAEPYLYRQYLKTYGYPRLTRVTGSI